MQKAPKSFCDSPLNELTSIGVFLLTQNIELLSKFGCRFVIDELLFLAFVFGCNFWLFLFIIFHVSVSTWLDFRLVCNTMLRATRPLENTHTHTVTL